MERTSRRHASLFEISALYAGQLSEGDMGKLTMESFLSEWAGACNWGPRHSPPFWAWEWLCQIAGLEFR